MIFAIPLHYCQSLLHCRSLEVCLKDLPADYKKALPLIAKVVEKVVMTAVMKLSR